MEKRKILRSRREPPEITVRIEEAGNEQATQDMMRDIQEAIQKRNRQSARTGGKEMSWRIELV